MQVWPLQFRRLGEDILMSNEAGSWFRAKPEFLDRYASGNTSKDDDAYFGKSGLAFEEVRDLAFTSHAFRWSARRTATAKAIDYVILVPTLRCNLSCAYCQVSRAAEGAKGFDWSEETLAGVLAYLDKLTTDRIQIEFQGGEPLLRLDLLNVVRDFCRRRFKQSRFVVCSNFQMVDEAIWDFFADDDTQLSTSIDGDIATHTNQRTGNVGQTMALLSNLEEFVDRFGHGRMSALPTIDPLNPPNLETLVETYERFGIHSIYLRPINRQGFARRRPEAAGELQAWNTLHAQFIDLIVEQNWEREVVVEEYYFTHLLRRILGLGANGHVDIRNPNPVGANYVVVDYDGTLFPTDEARMMARIGQIDLSIGNVQDGEDWSKVTGLNSASFNDQDPDCQHCVYQPFCGVDLVDDISRYGRIDMPRHETYFCRRHLALFDKAFAMITSKDPKIQHSLCKWLGIEKWPASYSEVKP
jgi:His-Xaa-Ser system radical SAM maturase HxsB